MLLSEFDFPFDPLLIASEPVIPKDRARLLVMDRSRGGLLHRTVADLPDLLRPGDLLVVNDTRVRPARVAGRKLPSGAAVELLFVRARSDRSWEVLAKGNLKAGQIIEVSPSDRVVVESRDSNTTVVRIESARAVGDFFERFGRMPLPPYIKRSPVEQDREWYQTVFARDEGAVAAPTAGLHFTPDLLDRLKQRGIGLAQITLHVGVGTFKPVTVERIEDHRMGAEWLDVGDKAVEAILATREAGGRAVAVGTTVVRALEAASAPQGELRPYRGETGLFIRPGHAFRAVDGLLTNFHLPKTTLLMLVSAFAGTVNLRRAYEEAVRERYRFFSYGDAMLIT